MKKVKGLSKKEKRKTHRHKSIVINKGKRIGGDRGSYGGINGDGRRLDLGW